DDRLRHPHPCEDRPSLCHPHRPPPTHHRQQPTPNPGPPTTPRPHPQRLPPPPRQRHHQPQHRHHHRPPHMERPPVAHLRRTQPAHPGHPRRPHSPRHHPNHPPPPPQPPPPPAGWTAPRARISAVLSLPTLALPAGLTVHATAHPTLRLIPDVPLPHLLDLTLNGILIYLAYLLTPHALALYLRFNRLLLAPSE